MVLSSRLLIFQPVFRDLLLTTSIELKYLSAYSQHALLFVYRLEQSICLDKITSLCPASIGSFVSFRFIQLPISAQNLEGFVQPWQDVVDLATNLTRQGTVLQAAKAFAIGVFTSQPLMAGNLAAAESNMVSLSLITYRLVETNSKPGVFKSTQAVNNGNKDIIAGGNLPHLVLHSFSIVQSISSVMS